VSYEVVESRYKIDPCMWERTIQFLVGQVQAAWGLEELFEFFVTADVSSRLQPQHVRSRWRSWGWWEVSADLAVQL
jgi:hypothetical protein